ncbi:hypothetical protein [uncultured Nocardioides sp.]|uniref:hypothetical protein n=1 Tax=uncultured Nocardioides sp. TaxID=198441 RepID=UPI002633DE05|nr:hypothetical protein [uncultured Nocardioides sp.]HRD61524.1 hypothetical protein [Nocardioides sp.]
MSIPAAWSRLVDDAAIFPPGDAPLHDATAAYGARSAEDGAELVGTFVLRDTDLPLVRGFGGPLSVVCTGGAGQLAGPIGLAAKLGLTVAGVEIAVRDLDDLAGNVRRVALAAADLGDVPVYVELPHVANSGAWLAAADEVAASGLRLKFRTGGLEASAFPAAHALARWIDAALDRETPFKCTAGLHHAVRRTDPETGFEHHGFLNVLVATRLLFDGAGVDDAVIVLKQHEPDTLVSAAHELDLAGARRWFTSFGSCSVSDPWADLRELGLVS